MSAFGILNKAVFNYYSYSIKDIHKVVNIDPSQPPFLYIYFETPEIAKDFASRYRDVFTEDNYVSLGKKKLHLFLKN